MGRAVWREMSVPALLILIIFVLECTGEMDSDHWPPCSADYGKGLPDDPTKRRWCYVNSGECNDEQLGRRTRRPWSYSACYEGFCYLPQNFTKVEKQKIKER